MDELEAHITLMQTQLTRAVKSGEPEDSPHLRQMDARLERMRRLWATHRRIRMERETSESADANHLR